jgi:hypothetical protein
LLTGTRASRIGPHWLSGLSRLSTGTALGTEFLRRELTVAVLVEREQRFGSIGDFLRAELAVLIGIEGGHHGRHHHHGTHPRLTWLSGLTRLRTRGRRASTGWRLRRCSGSRILSECQRRSGQQAQKGKSIGVLHGMQLWFGWNAAPFILAAGISHTMLPTPPAQIGEL